MKLLGRLPAERVTTLVSDQGIATKKKKTDMTTTDIPMTAITAPARGCSGPVELPRTRNFGSSAVVQSLFWSKSN